MSDELQPLLRYCSRLIDDGESVVAALRSSNFIQGTPPIYTVVIESKVDGGRMLRSSVPTTTSSELRAREWMVAIKQGCPAIELEYPRHLCERVGP